MIYLKILLFLSLFINIMKLKKNKINKINSKTTPKVKSKTKKKIRSKTKYNIPKKYLPDKLSPKDKIKQKN